MTTSRSPFTGSVRTGRPVTQAAAVLLRASVAATGQACQSPERIYVQRSVYPQLLARLVEAA